MKRTTWSSALAAIVVVTLGVQVSSAADIDRPEVPSYARIGASGPTDALAPPETDQVTAGKDSLVAPQQNGAAELDLGGVAETVRHHVKNVDPNMLQVEDRLYRAEFSSRGYVITLRQPAQGVSRLVGFDPKAAFEVSTVQVKTGSSLGAVSPTSWKAELNSASRAISPWIFERVTARDGNLEWDFVLSSRPSGGSVEITADVGASGKPSVLKGRAGPEIRWELEDGRAISMGELIVVDATGRQLHRSLPQIQGQRISLSVPEEVLDEAIYPVTIDPTVSPEYPAPASDPVYSTAPGYEPSVACGEGICLVVWLDRPSGVTDIWGTRVADDGSILDPAGILIGTSRTVTTHGTTTRVAWGDSVFMVVWDDAREDSDAGVYGARVTSAGYVLDPSGIPISTGRYNQNYWSDCGVRQWTAPSKPALEWDGQNFMVVWSDSRSGYLEVFGARVTPSGSVLDPAGFRIADSGHYDMPVGITWNGSTFMVVWVKCNSGARDIYGARVASSGSVLDPSGIPIAVGANRQHYPAVATDGTNFLVVWMGGGSELGIFGARITSSGSLLDPSGFTITGAAGEPVFPVIAWAGSSYLVAWGNDDRTTISAARVAPSGSVLDPSAITIAIGPGDRGVPDLAWNGSNSLIVWEDWLDVHGVRVTPSATVLDPATVLSRLKAANYQSDPVIAWSPSNYLVVWEEGWQDEYGWQVRVLAARMSHQGALLDAEGLRVSSRNKNQTDPAVTWDGTNFVVAWSEPSIYAARIATTGKLLDPSGISIGGTGPSSIASNGPVSLITFGGTFGCPRVWSLTGECNNWMTIKGLWGRRLTANGAVLESFSEPIPIALGGSQSPRSVSIAAIPLGYLVAMEWIDGIYAARVTPAGIATEPHRVSSGSNPSIAPSPFGPFIAWNASGSNPGGVYGLRLTPDGSPLGPDPLTIGTGSAAGPAVAWTGSSFVVTWNDARNGNADVYGARIDPSGSAILDPGGFPIASSPSGEGNASVTAAMPGTVAVAYTRFASELYPYGANRTFVRLVDTV